MWPDPYNFLAFSTKQGFKTSSIMGERREGRKKWELTTKGRLQFGNSKKGENRKVRNKNSETNVTAENTAPHKKRKH